MRWARPAPVDRGMIEKAAARRATTMQRLSKQDERGEEENVRQREPYYDLDLGATTWIRTRRLRDFFGCATIEGIMCRNVEGLKHDEPARIVPKRIAEERTAPKKRANLGT